jgi:SAM-dependent methyltransferase
VTKGCVVVDESRVEEFIGQLAGHMTGGAVALSVWLGDELGYYRALAGAGGRSADDVAAATGCNARLTREWLDGQAAAGIVTYDVGTDAYAMSDEVAMVLADDTSPAFMARGMNALMAMMIDGQRLADAYPNSTIHGFDFHAASIETAQTRADEAGVTGNTHFGVAGAKEYEGSYDLICFFDCLHDMGDPVGIARYAREHLEPGGTVLLVEPMALDDRATNIAENPLAALLYTASSAICTPNSLSQEVGLGLGAQAGEARLRAVFEEAGFTHFRRATESPLNMVLEARA